MDNLRVQTPGSKYCHFPKRDDYGSTYFKGLLSEHLVYNAEKKQPWAWEKIPGHERNERLDCRNYAIAAFKALSPNLDETERRLKVARGGSVPVDSTVIYAETVTPKKRKQKSRGISKVYDDW
jgi:phage terminase large subunit GpA-like protein